MKLGIPLEEVLLRVEFEAMEIPQERFGYIEQLLPPDGTESVRIDHGAIELRSKRKISFARLRDFWTTLLESTFATLDVSAVSAITLSYFNEIPLQDLRNFQEYVNISIDMPASLKDRIELFRTEFTYKYDFGDIRVWLHPDWDDETDGYAIRLNMESRKQGTVAIEDLIAAIDTMHNGLKDVFRQILSEEYLAQLPQ
jgi:uncharacterized protein (TIGR04255 family)